MCSISSDKQIALSFDNLFPETTFRSVLVGCMKLRGEVDLLLSKKSVQLDFDLISDMVVGALFQMCVALEKVTKQKDSVPPEDVEYLTCFFDKMLSDYDRFFSSKNESKVGCAVYLIKDIKLRLNDMVEKAN